jgi:polo-like kinase 1
MTELLKRRKRLNELEA